MWTDGGRTTEATQSISFPGAFGLGERKFETSLPEDSVLASVLEDSGGPSEICNRYPSLYDNKRDMMALDRSPELRVAIKVMASLE